MVGDVMNINAPDNYFDLAIDKSTIDTLLCSGNSFENVATTMKEVQRVLKPGGYLLSISYGKPENRV
jgi:ubiquinone/menaquinone biosynthesis C-methylase UbiE